MQLVEKHIIERNDPRYGAIDAAAFAFQESVQCHTLHCATGLLCRRGIPGLQHDETRSMQKHESYRGLPTKVAQGVVKQVHRHG